MLLWRCREIKINDGYKRDRLVQSSIYKKRDRTGAPVPLLNQGQGVQLTRS